ncbi:hypothetical protein, partial [Amycolatopsis sulphurea]
MRRRHIPEWIDEAKRRNAAMESGAVRRRHIDGAAEPGEASACRNGVRRCAPEAHPGMDRRGEAAKRRNGVRRCA